jgi:hypothetical protein
MAALVGKRIRSAQPQQAPQIDWGNPITAGLVFAYTMGNEAQGWCEDGRNGIQYVRTSDGAQYGRQINTLTGTAGQLLAGSAYLFGGPTQSSVKTGSYSLFAFGTGPGSGMQSALDDDDGVTRRFQFRLNAGKAELIPFYSGGNGSVAAAATLSAYDLANGFAMGATVNGTSYAVYQKGIKASATLGGAAQAPNSQIYVGARKTAAQQWLTGGLMLVAMWNRPLTDAEHQSLADNPWQLFKGPPRRVWMVRAPAAAYLLQAASGAFLLSASPAVLSAARRLAVAAGALTTAWSPANLIASRRLPAATGTFGMTGSAAMIQAARKIAASAGSFGIAGAASSMTVARRLAAQPGAFVLSPGSAQMVYTPNPAPGGPTYTLTAVAGAFTLAAGVAGVLARRRLSSMSGSFVLAGAAAALRASRCMPAQAGAFNLSGADAQLRYSAQPTYARGPAGAGYAPQQHYNEGRPAAARGPRPVAMQRNTR